jgi:hypothetical protein
MILEGKSCCVLLYPADSGDAKDPDTKPLGKRGKTLVVFAVAAAAAAGIWIPLARQHDYENPDQP